MVGKLAGSIPRQSGWAVLTASEMPSALIKSQDLTSPLLFPSLSFFWVSRVCLGALRFPCVGGRCAGLSGWESPMIYGSFAGLTASHLAADGAGGNEGRFLQSSPPPVLANPILLIWDLKPLPGSLLGRFNWGRFIRVLRGVIGSIFLQVRVRITWIRC